MNGSTRRAGLAAYGLGLCALAAGCAVGADPGKPAGAGRSAAPAVPVTVASVVRKSVPIQVPAVGTVEAYSTVMVRAQVTGELVEVNFKEGQDVREGDVLFRLDARPYDAQLKQAEAALARDTAQAANARSTLSRYADLQSRGIATREQLDQATTALAAIDAALKADQAAIDNAQVQVQYCTIRTPISGRTGALLVHQGNLVRATDTTPLVTINQVSPIFVSFAVPEQYLSDIKRFTAAGALGLTAHAPNDSGAPAKGGVSFVDNAVDPSTGTIRLKGTFTNPGKQLWPGEFVDVVLTLTMRADALVVPADAVQTGQQGTFVFVVKDDKTVEARPIKVDLTINGESIITDGLRDGERLVTDGQLRLTPGATVDAKPAAGAPAQ